MRVAIQQSYDPVEVDLWGHLFHTKPITRSVQKEGEKLEEKLIETDDADEVVALTAQLLDLRLVASDGKRKKPSTLIKEKWEGDELSLPQLNEFGQAVLDAERPT